MLFCNKEFWDMLVIYRCLFVKLFWILCSKEADTIFFLLYTRWFRHFVYKDPYKDKFRLVSQHFPPLIYALNMSPKTTWMQRFVSQDNWFTDRFRNPSKCFRKWAVCLKTGLWLLSLFWWDDSCESHYKLGITSKEIRISLQGNREKKAKEAED